MLIDKKKIAGILIDTLSKGNEVSELYVGIGINTKIAPSNLEYKTTSIKNENFKNISRKKMLNKLIFYFDQWESILKKNSFSYILKCWMKRSIPINSNVSFKEKEKTIKGIYKGINETGEIRLLINNKESSFFNLDTLA